MQKKTSRRRAASRFFLFKGLAFILGAVVIWLLLDARYLQEFFAAYNQRNNQKDTNENLAQNILNMKHQRTSLELHGSETEKQVRELLNMHRADEKVIYIKSQDTPVVTSAPSSLVRPGDEESTNPRASRVDKSANLKKNAAHQ